MIGWLKGKIVDVSDSSGQRITLAISDPVTGTGLGYQVLVANRLDSPVLLEGDTLELFIHTHVREDALELFGFRERQERDLFLTLMSVNGIGPKLAISILSNAAPARIVRAISDGHVKSLTDLPGIGKKMAERMILELAETIKKKIAAGVYQTSSASVGSEHGKAHSTAVAPTPSAHLSEPMRDAVMALGGLGYRESDALAMVEAAAESARAVLSDEACAQLTTQDWIRRCLAKTSHRSPMLGERHA